MASFILSRSFLVLILALISLFSRILAAKSSFSFSSIGKNASFESDDISLYGEAKLVDGGDSIQLTDSVSHGGGGVVYKKPIEFVRTETDYPAGFSTFFSFSISPSNGGRLGFVVFSVNGTSDHSLFEVKFDTSENLTKFGDNVTVIVDGTMDSQKIRNFTIENLEKKETLLLYAWINYEGGGLLEVRLSKSESFDSVHPLVFYRIVSSEMLINEGKFMVGMKSYSGNINLHSWSLEVRQVSKFLHSYLPLYIESLRKEEEAKKRRRQRVWEIVTWFIMTFGSTGLVFFTIIHLWAAFKRYKLVMVMPEECGLKTKEFEYEKMEKIEAVMSKDEVQQEK